MIKFVEEKESLLNYLKTETQKEYKKDETFIWVYIISLLGLFITCLFIFHSLLNTILCALIYTIIYAAISLVILYSDYSNLSFPTRLMIIEDLFEISENNTLLKLTFDSKENKIIYKYSIDGLVETEEFVPDKIETRTDIEEDTLFVGKELVYAKKYKEKS